MVGSEIAILLDRHIHDAPAIIPQSILEYVKIAGQLP